MDLDGQAHRIPGQWPTAATSPPRARTPPMAVRSVATNIAAVTYGDDDDSSPVDPHDFYNSSTYTTPPSRISIERPRQSPKHVRQSSSRTRAGSGIPLPRSYSRSPTRTHQQRSVSGPAAPTQRTLNNARSHPVLLSSRQPGNVRDIASKIDQTTAGDGRPALKVNTNRDRSRPPPAQSSARAATYSPLSASSGDGKSGIAKLTKRKPGQREPKKAQSPSTSFDNNTSSFSSTNTTMTTQSQPPMTGMRQHVNAKPLFGEITSDGQWNGNFDISQYAPLPDFNAARGRSSDGGFTGVHTRSQSHQNMSPSDNLPWEADDSAQTQRTRSRSDIENPVPPTSESSSRIPMPARPEQPASHSTSRISVIRRRQSSEAGGASSYTHSRNPSSISNTAQRTTPSRSIPQPSSTVSRENTPQSGPRNRYNPPTLPPLQSSQTLSAKIVAPLPKLSPPLRSSRPRQPVNSSTTSASRARAADKFQLEGPAVTKDSRAPSEQWLGKPYDPQKEQVRRRIPELSNVDFEARRARIQKAISQNLESARSEESLRNQANALSRTHSNVTSPMEEPESDTGPGAENDVDMHQAEILDRETEMISSPNRHATPKISQQHRLSVDTNNLTAASEDDPDPWTAATERTIFEEESPVFGHVGYASQVPHVPPQPALPTLLSSAAYRAPVKNQPPPEIIVPEQQADKNVRVATPDILETAMRMDQNGGASLRTTNTEQQPAIRKPAEDNSPSVYSQPWSPADSTLSRDIGSIKIMLDDDRGQTPVDGQALAQYPPLQTHSRFDGQPTPAQDWSDRGYATNQMTDSPTDALSEDGVLRTPTNQAPPENVLTSAVYTPDNHQRQPEDAAYDGIIARTLRQYQSTGSITPAMYEAMQAQTVDLDRLSANGGSNAIAVQNLLESILDQRAMNDAQVPQHQDRIVERHLTVSDSMIDLPAVTPDTPHFEDFTPGTVLVYGSNQQLAPDDEDEEDFEAKIRRADEEWERHQRGEEQHFPTRHDGAVEPPPPPPPKDVGYTPRSTSGPNSATFPTSAALGGLRISALDADRIPDGHLNESDNLPGPPQPSHTPPVPPTPNTKLAPSDTIDSGRASSELFPPQPWQESNSSRPSMDSQRARKPIPSSRSVTSVTTESLRKESVEGTVDPSAPPANAVGSAEHKRLLKRKHIIKELLDTENTYHQDLKIIEDIYKATCSPDLMPPEDKKVLFGNCDEIERFALEFYDELRKAANPVYVPGRGARFQNRRNSESTTQSDSTAPVNMADNLDEEKDRTSSIGKCFLAHIPRMEQMYGAYLKNHDAANKRLDAIQDIDTVKCWLDECHRNASDITTAWDLDSLLVKPTQRVAKYPMLVQQLIETTPKEHPDHEDLKTAATSLVDMLTRINEAKKRADLVDQIINRKRKDSDMRSGLAKAFGRRTEKLKERVGMAEAYQDPEFDELAHKFGGHYIRLQICMRDVQEYVTRTSHAVDLVANFAAALELYTDVYASPLPEIEAKWRRYGQVIRDLTVVAYAEHKAAVQKRVLDPMVQCIKLHHGPQNAINKRKKRVVDYAKSQSELKKNQKTDKRTAEAAEEYTVLNEQLKIELPKLYGLTASLVQNCLICFLDIQQQWQSTWERKLKPLLEEADIPQSLEQIESAFRPDFLDAEARCKKLNICNGSMRSDAASFLSGGTTLVDNSDNASAKTRPSMVESSRRDSDPSGSAGRRYSGDVSNHGEGGGRIRSDSSMSARGGASQTSLTYSSRPWSHSTTNTPSVSRPGTSSAPSVPAISYAMTRTSSDNPRSPPMTRPGSTNTYYTARPDRETVTSAPRFSGIFTSALPVEIAEPASSNPQPHRPQPQHYHTAPRSSTDTASSSLHQHQYQQYQPTQYQPHQYTMQPQLYQSHSYQTPPLNPSINQPSRAASPPPTHTSAATTAGAPQATAPADTPVLFVCASLFEFSIERTRREGGYPYLTYVSGEVFDVVAQKGELWLARNQDDKRGMLGWIWEQHFIVLSAGD